MLRCLIITMVLVSTTLAAPRFNPKLDPTAREQILQMEKARWLQDSAPPFSLQESRDLESYDVLYYDLDMTLFSDDDFHTGTVRMDLASLENDLTSLTLHAGTNLSITSVSDGSDPLTFQHTGELVEVTLNTPLNTGDTMSCLIEFTATHNGDGIMSTQEYNVQTEETIQVDAVQAEPFDARNWWPCKDDTRDKADSVRVRVMTDVDNMVVGNGVLESDTDNGDGTRTFQWFERWPIVTYLVAIAVAPFNHYETVWEYDDVQLPMHDWSWGFDEEFQQEATEFGMDALTVLSNLYGLYPFHDEKYGHAQYQWGGAMEHQTCSYFSTWGYQGIVIVHELSHQWFGDKVTCRTFHDIWLNEGWATYSEALYVEATQGEEAMHEYMQGEQYWGDGTIYVEDPEHDVIFHGGLSYSKASWVVHMLRHIMGEDAFWSAVHNYLGDDDRENYRTATTANFQAFMEDASGLDLDYFFQQWIYGAWYPEYLYQYNVESNGDSSIVTLNVLQEQYPAHQAFAMPVDVRVSLLGGQDSTVVVWNDDFAQSFELTLPAGVSGLELDPDEWILRQAEQVDEFPEAPEILGVRLLDADENEIDHVSPGQMFYVDVELRNLGADLFDAEVGLSTDHEGITVLTENFTDQRFQFAERWEGLRFQCQADADVSGAAQIVLQITWTGGSLSAEYSILTGTPDILLVDDDGGDTFESWLEESLLPWGFGRTITESEFVDEDLENYHLLIWLQGNNARLLTEEQRDHLQSFMTGENRMVVFTGQNFSQAQVETPPNWLEEFAGVTVLDSDHQANAVFADPGGLMAGNNLFLFNDCADNQESMDVLETVDDCTFPVMHYQNLETPGSAALWKPYGENSGVLTCGFGLEGVSGVIPMTRDDLLQYLYQVALGSESLSVPVNTVPRSLQITAAYPNPFNPATQINLFVPRRTDVHLKVFNMLGQLVGTLHQGELDPGEYSFTWNAERMPSGVYFVRASSPETRDVRKMLLIR